VTYYASADGVAGVEVRGAGASAATALTDLAGEFGFSGLASGEFRLEPRKIGGGNGAVSPLDAAYALQEAATVRTLTPEQRVACDVTGNGSVSALDAARILQRVVGLSTLPAAVTCASDWAFLPAADVVPHQTVFDPAFPAGGCQAGAVAFTPLDGDAQGQDFRAVLFGDCTGNWRPQTGAAASARRRAASSAHLGRARRGETRGEIVAPLLVRGTDPLHAFEATLSFDPARVRSVRVRLAPAARGAMLTVNARRQGLLIVALASARPIDPTEGAILEVVHERRGRGHRLGRVRIVEASYSEQW
jgi:hypothetical protein